jgi:hypothetical protein
VSYSPEREEKNCLNCNAVIYGRYCHVCGQENTEPKETFLHWLSHFMQDITHFDGNFFNTLKYLLFKPAFLSKQYLRGKRVSYLHPIRMYVFTSAVFFFILFTIKKEDSFKKMQEQIDELPQNDSVKISQQNKYANDSTKYHYTQTAKPDSSKVRFKVGKKNDDIITITDDGDSVLTKNSSKLSEFGKKLSDHKEEIKHRAPYVMFCTLPLMALILMLLYRKKKDFFYVSHLILIVHIFTAIFIMYMMQYSFDFAGRYLWKGFFGTLHSILSIVSFFYVYKSLKNYYEQGWFKTLVKCCLLYFFFAIIYLLVYAIIISPTLFFN